MGEFEILNIFPFVRVEPPAELYDIIHVNRIILITIPLPSKEQLITL